MAEFPPRNVRRLILPLSRQKFANFSSRTRTSCPKQKFTNVFSQLLAPIRPMFMEAKYCTQMLIFEQDLVWHDFYGRKSSAKPCPRFHFRPKCWLSSKCLASIWSSRSSQKSCSDAARICRIQTPPHTHNHSVLYTQRTGFVDGPGQP